MNENSIARCTRVGIALSMILSPLLFTVGFGLHPLEGDEAAKAFQTVRDSQGWWAAAHILLLLGGALLIPASVGVAQRLGQGRSWLGLTGVALIVVGAVFFGALIGAEALTTSAMATLPADQRAGLTPAIQAIIDGKGALAVVNVALLMLVGLLLLAIGLVFTSSAPRWVGVVTFAAALVMAPVSNERVEAVGGLLLLISFGYLGLEALRSGVLDQTLSGEQPRVARA